MRQQKLNPAISIFGIILQVVFTSFVISGQAPASDEKCELLPIQSTERQIKKAEAQCYRFDIQKGQFIEVSVEQKGADVVLKVFDTGGQIVAEIDSPTGARGTEILPVVATATGVYKLSVQNLESPDAAKSAYIISSAAAREATESERRRFDARHAFVQAKYADAPAEKPELFLKAAELFNANNDRQAVAETLTELGIVYLQEIRNPVGALKAFNDALAIYREISNTREAAKTIKYIGYVYFLARQYEKAFEKYEQAVPLFDSADKGDKADTLDAIGQIYYYKTEFAKALEKFDEARALFESVGNHERQAGSINNAGVVYLEIGQKQTALKKFNVGLAMAEKYGFKQTPFLSNIGRVYDDLNKKQEALRYFERAKDSTKESNEQAYILLNMGKSQFETGKTEEGIKGLDESVKLFEEVGDKFGESRALHTLASVYSRKGDKEKAVEYYNRALTIQKTFRFSRGEGVTLGNLMTVWKASGKNRLAIFYGKRAVNIFQQIRTTIQNFDEESQRLFLKSVEVTYRTLAALLIDEGRIAEAQEVLVMLKGEEYFQYSQRNPDSVPALNRQIELNKEETEAARKYKASTGDAEFIGVLQEFAASFSQSSAEKPIEAANSQTRLWQEKLAALDTETVLLTTLVTGNRYYVIVTSKTGQIARKRELSKTDFEKLEKLPRLLKFRGSTYRPASRAVYDILVKPVEADLASLKAKTLLWSLDGGLRYIPVAALHDGTQFLLEKYSSAIVTLAQPAPDFSVTPQNWRALGGGVSDAYEKLPALTYVKGELDNIVYGEDLKMKAAGKGAFAGKILFNGDFSRKNLTNTLGQKFQLIHFATHFVLKSGNESDSFLLLGNKEKLYLNELRNFNFSGVDLLTLSACQTDATYIDANGVEIESLGVIAQKRGAKTVIASLWKIYDRSTPALMREFYTRYQSGNGLVSKAEALRQAQLAILNNKTGQNYKHPVYWAPFIILGEWR